MVVVAKEVIVTMIRGLLGNTGRHGVARESPWGTPRSRRVARVHTCLLGYTCCHGVARETHVVARETHVVARETHVVAREHGLSWRC